MRDVSRITSSREPARSLTLDEVRALRVGLRADQQAVERDLPDLVDFMLGTGLRIGEVLAMMTWSAVDLAAGQGSVLQLRPKTRNRWRRLDLPLWLIEVLATRERTATEWDVVFPSQLGRLRDRSNTNADVREALAPLGFGWVTTHVFRKTAATLLDEGGLSVREIADQLGHRRVSVTQDTYFGRHQASPKVAAALDVIGRAAK